VSTLADEIKPPLIETPEVSPLRSQTPDQTELRQSRRREEISYRKSITKPIRRLRQERGEGNGGSFMVLNCIDNISSTIVVWSVVPY
jgi:hypothetical protein